MVSHFHKLIHFILGISKIFNFPGFIYLKENLLRTNKMKQLIKIIIELLLLL